MDTGVYEHSLEEEARKSAAHRLAEGKGHLPIEQRNEPAERALVDQLTERAQSGEHFPSSLHPE